MINTKLHTTAGVKDYLPAECALKNEIEAKIKAVFDSYNYKCVITPTFEYIEVYDGMGGVDSKRMYKFLDRDGSILALRPDVTPAIARVAATAYDKTDLPLRFSYVGNAFRYNESYQGKLREFTQAGVELIGVNSVEADAEALIIAINSLLAVGLEDFRVDIANVDFLKGVLEEAQLDSELSEAVTDAIVEKNYVEVVKLTEELNIADKLKTLFNDLPLLIGDVSTLDTAKALVSNEKSINAIEYMRRLYEILDGCGYSKYVSFDLSVTGHFDYYTGIVFRAYARGTGFSVIDGGRYDKLVGNYGEAYPAVGLAVKINDIMSVIKPTEVKSADVLVAYDNNDEDALMALRMADELRKSGKTAELSLLGSDIETNKAYALKNNIGTLLYINGKECRTIFVKEAE
jgi:ATP phosphoribosyltransferase regulatory subunit